jgi:hypothetical protein
MTTWSWQAVFYICGAVGFIWAILWFLTYRNFPEQHPFVNETELEHIRGRDAAGNKLILEPIFEADFQPGSFGYRPKRTAHAAVNRVAEAIVRRKTRVIDCDLRAYFDNGLDFRRASVVIFSRDPQQGGKNDLFAFRLDRILIACSTALRSRADAFARIISLRV